MAKFVYRAFDDDTGKPVTGYGTKGHAEVAASMHEDSVGVFCVYRYRVLVPLTRTLDPKYKVLVG